MHIKVLLLASAIVLAGCEPAVQSGQRGSSSDAKSGAPRVADYSPPSGCQEKPARIVGYATRNERVTICRRNEADGDIAVALREISVPLDSSFVSDRDLSDAALSSPRSILIPYLQESLRRSFAFLETGIPIRNKKVRILDGDGGVAGADACLRFSYDSTSRDTAGGVSQWVGLDCARLNAEDRLIDEAYISVGGDRPRSTPDPDWYTKTMQSTIRSLRFR